MKGDTAQRFDFIFFTFFIHLTFLSPLFGVSLGFFYMLTLWTKLNDFNRGLEDSSCDHWGSKELETTLSTSLN